MSNYIQPLTVPSGTEIPGSAQGIVDLLAEYLAIKGQGNVIGLNFGSTTPAEEDRDKPWFKRTPSGSPVGFYSWSGLDWIKTPTVPASGTTAERPVSPANATHFFDTTLNCALIFERSKWRTLHGSPGDIKHVGKETLAEAIAANPGWKEYAEATGRVLGVAGSGSGFTERAFGDKAGAEETTLSLAQLPRFTPSVNFILSSNYTQSGSNIEGAPGSQGGEKKLTGDPIGEGKAHSNMQPTIFVWCLIKE